MARYYPTKADFIAQEILPALEGEANAFDVEGIWDDLQASSEVFYDSRGGWRVQDADEEDGGGLYHQYFWDIVEANAREVVEA